MIDFYQTLGVKRTATTEQIERAYDRLKKKRKPPASDEVATGFYNAMQAEIDNAYLTLSDLASRQRFDAELDHVELAESIGTDFKEVKATNRQVKMIGMLLKARAKARIAMSKA